MPSPTRTLPALALCAALATGACGSPQDPPRDPPAAARAQPASSGARATAPAAAPAARRPLAGRVVVLDPGHDGGNASHPREIARLVPAGGFRKACNTVGTQTAAGYPEHAFTWSVARLVAVRLRRLGARVVLTRHTDRGVGPCVDARARTGNRAHADAVLSIHADGASARVRGFHVIEPGLAPDRGNRRALRPSARLAHRLLTAYARGTRLPRATYPGGIVAPGLARRTDLAGLDLTRVPSALVECGNMRNRRDAAVMSSARGRARIADALVAGLRAALR